MSEMKMSEILTQSGIELQIRANPIDGTYTARVFGQTRTFDTIEQAVEWACAVRDRGGKE